jgi:hypothetical protein
MSNPPPRIFTVWSTIETVRGRLSHRDLLRGEVELERLCADRRIQLHLITTGP